MRSGSEDFWRGHNDAVGDGALSMRQSKRRWTKESEPPRGDRRGARGHGDDNPLGVRIRRRCRPRGIARSVGDDERWISSRSGRVPRGCSDGGHPLAGRRAAGDSEGSGSDEGRLPVIELPSSFVDPKRFSPARRSGVRDSGLLDGSTQSTRCSSTRGPETPDPFLGHGRREVATPDPSRTGRSATAASRTAAEPGAGSRLRRPTALLPSRSRNSRALALSSVAHTVASSGIGQKSRRRQSPEARRAELHLRDATLPLTRSAPQVTRDRAEGASSRCRLPRLRASPPTSTSDAAPGDAEAHGSSSDTGRDPGSAS